MHKTAGQLAPKEPADHATERKPAAKAAGRTGGKHQSPDIHPSLRALPDYPE